MSYWVPRFSVHSIGIHRLARVEVVILEVGPDDLCEVALNLLLERLDGGIVLAGLLELFNNFL